MPPENLIEICGTVAVPSCIAAAEGAPHLGVRVEVGGGEDATVMATGGCQTFASQMPYSLVLDLDSLPQGAEPTLVASYSSEQSCFSLSTPLQLDRCGPTISRDLVIPGSDAQPGEGQPPQIPAIITLNNTIEIPEAVLQAKAQLTLGLYRIQENGHSNQRSSHIAGSVLWPTQSTLALTTYVDGNTLLDDEQLVLRVVYWDPDTQTPYAGKTLRNLTLSEVAAQGLITLRPPRRS